MLISIGGETRDINAADIISLCMKKNVTILTNTYTGRVSFRGKRNDVTRLREIISASPELEASIMLELSKSCQSLRDTIVERACIADLKTIEDSAIFLVTKQETPEDDYC